VGVTKTLFILVAAILLDRVGRRPLLLCSAGGMMVSLVGLGTGLTVVGHHPDAGKILSAKKNEKSDNRVSRLSPVFKILSPRSLQYQVIPPPGFT
jgi:MFS family permease